MNRVSFAGNKFSMSSEPEKKTTWLDDLTALIKKKEAENLALRKVQESFLSRKSKKEKESKEVSEEDHKQIESDDEASNSNEPNQ
jgi:hypothetical protein